jgi:hypothetical protein
MVYEDKGVLFKSSLFHQQTKKEAKGHIHWFGGEIDSTCISIFVPTGNFKHWGASEKAIMGVLCSKYTQMCNVVKYGQHVA